MNKKFVVVVIVIIIVITIIVCFINRGTYSAGSGSSSVHFLNVAGRTGADAILIESNGHYGLVDSANPYNDPDAYGNDNGDTLDRKCTVEHVIDYLDYLGVEKLDFIVATHAHYDHIGGMNRIASKYVDSNTKYYYRTYVNTKEDTENPEWNNRVFYNKAINAMQSAGAQLVEVTNKNPNFMMGDFNIRILNTTPWGPEDPAYHAYGDSSLAPGDNANSLGVLLNNNGVKLFLAGDLESYDEKVIASAIGKVDILKPGHHLYSESSSYDFLKVLQPNYVIATNNRSTRFDIGNAHINYAAMGYLINNFGTTIYATSGNNITFDAIKVDISNGDYSINTNTINSSTSQNVSAAKINNISSLSVRNTWYRMSQDFWWVYYNASGMYAKNEWIQDTDAGYWYYVGDDGVTVNGLHEINGQYYYFTVANDKTNCTMKTKWVEIDGDWYWFNTETINENGVRIPEGARLSSRWVKNNDLWFYLLADGKMATGLQEIDGKYYYFEDRDETFLGKMLTGFVQIGNDKYWFNKTKTDSLPEGAMYKNMWLSLNSKYYYLDSDGKMVTGTKVIDGKTYTFDENGIMLSGWIQNGDNWYYYNSSGVMVKNDWLLYNNVYYYLDNDGKMVTGWHYLDSTVDGYYWYYFTQDGVYKAKVTSSTYDFDFAKGFIYAGLETNTNMVMDGFKYSGSSKRVVNNKLQLIYDNRVVKELKIVYLDSDDYVITNDYIFYGNNKNTFIQNIDCSYCKVEINGNIATVKFDNQVLGTYSLIGINTNYIIKNNKIYVGSDYGNNSAILNNITSSSCTIGIENDRVIIKYNNATIKEYTISNEDNHFTIKSDYNELLNQSNVIYNLANGIYGKELFESFDTNADVALYRKNTLLNRFESVATGDILQVTYGMTTSNPTTYKMSVRGDILGEGKMTIAGAKKAAQHIIEGNVLQNEYLKAADITGDGKVKMNDVVLIALNEEIDVTCSGTYQSGVSTINIKNNNNTELVKYVINGTSYTTSSITLNSEYKNVMVKVYSKHGKMIQTNCKVDNNEVVNWHFSSISGYSAIKITNNVYLHAYGDSPAISYWIYFPDKVYKNLPLIMFIPGNGTQGNDYNNYVPGDTSGSAIWYGPIKEVLEYGAKYNAIVIHPQVPNGYDVRNVMGDFRLLANAVANTLKADKKKISIIGFSHGCYGLMDDINSNRSYYAAAVPIGCAPSEAEPSAFATTQLWAFSGSGDGSNTLPGFVTSVSAINGGKAWYTGVNGPHECVDMILRNDRYGLMKWLSEDVSRP